MVALLVVFTILLFLTADYLVTVFSHSEVPAGVTAGGNVATAIGAAESEAGPARLDYIPEGLYVSQGHVWAKPAGEGVVRIGVDRIIPALLGGMEWLYGLAEGVEVRRGGPLVMMRKGGRALQLRSPADGFISRVNRKVTQHPADVAADPFGEGWLYEIRLRKSSGALRELLSGEKATRWMRQEAARLFYLVMHFSNHATPAPVFMPDGGVPLHHELGSHIEAALSDEEWRELIASFFLESDDRASTSVRL